MRSGYRRLVAVAASVGEAGLVDLALCRFVGSEPLSSRQRWCWPLLGLLENRLEMSRCVGRPVV